jgi:23S rRNA (adenine2503-C2)-methyltransferase
LIPISRPGTLEELRSALVEASAFARRPIFIEHLLLDGINDSAEEAQALVDYLEGLPVHVNLLPLQPVAGDGSAGDRGTLRPPPPERLAAFRAALESAGFPVTLRRSLGGDIAAACGQLAGRRS